MPQTLIPIHIKPHLVPFLFKKLKCVECNYEGRKVKAAKVTNHTSLGRFTRLLLEKSDRKTVCDKSAQTFLVVSESAKPLAYMKGAFKYEDGRSSFLNMPEAGIRLINEYLEEDFETASMFFIHSRYQADGEESLNAGILEFFERYDLEEFEFNIARIRRDYYRKLDSGFFKAKVTFNLISKKLELAR